MTVLVDASALVAIMTQEDDAARLETVLERHNSRLYCATGAWETIRAVARIHNVDVSKASETIDTLFRNLDFRLVPIGEAEGRLAIDAHRRYGKGTGHPAALNMGDCFAYACAKTNEAMLLYKGDDFVHTDLA